MNRVVRRNPVVSKRRENLFIRVSMTSGSCYKNTVASVSVWLNDKMFGRKKIHYQALVSNEFSKTKEN